MSDDIKLLAARMMRVFQGNKEGHYVADFRNVTIEKGGKRVPVYRDVKGPPTLQEFEDHLNGKLGLVLVPLTQSGACRWGKIDTDDYTGDTLARAIGYAKQIDRWALPMIVELSKSGGAQLAHYDPYTQSAEDMRAKLADWSAALKIKPGTEIFPKQGRLMPGEIGSGINLPYFFGDSPECRNYAIDKDGKRLSVKEWLDIIERMPANAGYTPGRMNVEAAADLLSKHWTDGNRDNLSLAVAGTLLRAGVETDSVQELLDACRSIAVDDGQHASAARVEAMMNNGKKVPGFPKLAEYIGMADAKEFMRLAGTKPSPRDLEPPVVMIGFTLEDLNQPIREETYLLPGLVPTEAYTLIAGALSSYKSMLLLNMIVWRATGYDLLGLSSNEICRVAKAGDPGPCVLASYEDTDWRIFARLQRILNTGAQTIRSVHGKEAAAEFLSHAVKNIQRIPLTARLGKTLVFRTNGYIVPNYEFIDEFEALVRTYTTSGVLIGLDPLRLAIAGSQNDDDGADVVVQLLNLLSVVNPGSGLAVVSHTNKVVSQNGSGNGGGYADAAYATSGSALYSQHARSNFWLARLKGEEIRKLFDLPPEECDRQAVARLTHGRLSHGIESREMFMRMSGAGLLVPAVPRAQTVSAREEIDRGLPVMVGAVARLTAAGVTVSATAVAKDPEVNREIGGLKAVKALARLLIENGHLQEAGSTSNRHLAVTEKARARISELEELSRNREPGDDM